MTLYNVVKIHPSCRRKFRDNRSLKNHICRLPTAVNDCVLVVTVSVGKSHVICVKKL